MKKRVLIILGVILGVIALAGGGMFINQKVQANKESKAQQMQEEKEKQYQEALKESQKLKEENEQKLEDLKNRKKDLEAKEITLKVQKNEEFMSNGFSQKYYELGNELSDISKEISSVEREIRNLEDTTFDDVSSIIDDMRDEKEEDTSGVFKFSRFMFIIPIIIFILAFGVIIIGFVKSSKSMTSMINGSAAKDMLNDLSDIAVKMAKDLNPTYQEFKCPNCGATLDPENTDIKQCGYCGAKLYKTVNRNGSNTHKSK